MKIQDFIVEESCLISQMLEKLDANGRGIIFVCENRALRGVISDGDVRRYMLHGGEMNLPVQTMANYSPKYLFRYSQTDIQQFLHENSITAVPIINSLEEIIGIHFDTGETIREYECLGVPVVIMAGGKGTRLYPYTQILPKPLIPIGDKTITEHIIEQFEHYGCLDITMIVNYKKNFIETYFSEIDRPWKIQFVEEDKFLGTGGGLKLLSNIKQTFFMTNCDVLIDADYSEILTYHQKNKNILTMVCARKEVEIPYGTVEMDCEGNLLELREKPRMSFCVNTGLYVIEPDLLNKIPADTFIHITEVMQKCLREGEKIGVYTIEDESWMDMGQMDELEKMRKKFER